MLRYDVSANMGGYLKAVESHRLITAFILFVVGHDPWGDMKDGELSWEKHDLTVMVSFSILLRCKF
jgi:hypothetical protein